MTRVFITGDKHGEIDIADLGSRGFDAHGLWKDDYVIIAGDFGLVWSDPPDASEKYWLDWLEEKPFTTLFVDGNHENHDMLAGLPVETWHGGRVHRVRDSVIHLMRGEAYDIGGDTYFCMGGAYSHDIEERTEGVSWWPAEVPSEEEREHAAETIRRIGRADYVITHCPPWDAHVDVCNKVGEYMFPDEYNRWLQDEVADKLKFGSWFFGHLHKNCVATEGYCCVYGSVWEATGNGSAVKVPKPKKHLTRHEREARAAEDALKAPEIITGLSARPAAMPAGLREVEVARSR